MNRTPRRHDSNLAIQVLKLAIALTLSIPTQASEPTEILLGAGFGPFRYFSARGFASVELTRPMAKGPLGFWTALDVSKSGTYFGLGPRIEWPLGSRGTVAIGTGPGWYSDGLALKLGSKLEFRSTVYAMFRMSSHLRAGVSLSHYSNGGIAYHNPGAETVRLLVAVPL